MPNGQVVQPDKLTLCFVGPMNYPATKNLRNACCQAVNTKVKTLTLQMSSPGGSLIEGFALYSFLKSLPLELRTHNIGSIESVANMPFFAGVRRSSVPHARFMFHDLTWGFGDKETLDRDRIKEKTDSLDADAARFVEILKLNTSISEANLETLQLFKQTSVVPASRAKEVGLIHEIAETKISPGEVVFNIDF